MIESSRAVSAIAVNNINEAKEFYGNTIGLTLEDNGGSFTIKLESGNNVMVYQEDEAFSCAGFAILTFPVGDIDAAVDDLLARNVVIDREDAKAEPDSKGIMRFGDTQGPGVALFKDPTGNILSVVQFPSA